jgi:hypothetical protein
MNRESTSRAAGLALFLCLLAPQAYAGSFSAVGGYDYYQSPVSLTRGFVGALGMDVAPVSAALAAVRYDDGLTGEGTSAIATVGWRVHSAALLSGQVTRFLGDEGYRAWRLKLGPQLLLAGSRTSLSYVRDQEDFGPLTQSAVIETEVPFVASWKARGNASYATTDAGLHGVQGALGLGWSPVPRLELAGEVGLAQQVAVSYGPVHRPLLPILGGPPQAPESKSETSFSPTALVSIRVSAP